MEAIKATQIIKNLNQVLSIAQRRYSKADIVPDVELCPCFKKAFSDYLHTKNCSVKCFDGTTVVTNKSRQHIYIANQWFLIASYFVDFCSEMLSYRDIYMKVCGRMGMNNAQIKKYTTYLRTAPQLSEKNRFISFSKEYLQEEFGTIGDDYNKVSNYLWQFASDYKWWSGKKTIDRHDFYISALLNQMNVVNANSEYLAIITLAYAENYDLRILAENTCNIAVNADEERIEVYSDEEIHDFMELRDPGNTSTPISEHSGISISAASLERFHNKGNI